MSICTTTLGDKPTYDPPDNIVGINRFVMRTGASRAGKGIFALTRKDYDQLVKDTATAGGTTTLVMKGDPGPGLTLSVVLAGAEPLVTSSGSDHALDLMKVTVYDQRAKNFSPIKKFYNVMRDGFPVDGSNNPICFASTLKSGTTPWTWNQILIDSKMATTALIPEDLPAWTPYNLIWDNTPLSLAMDDVAAQLFYVVGFDHQQPLANSQKFIPPYLSAKGPEQTNLGFTVDSDTPNNSALLDQATQKNALMSGAIPGDPAAAERNNNRLPGKIDVVFPGVGDSDPYSTHRSYTNTVKTGFGASDYTVVLNVGNQFASWNGSAWANQATLDPIATDLAARAAILLSQAFGQAEFAGIWPFRPDGRFRQVEWVSYPKGHPQEGARTIIKSDNAKDWLPGDSLDDPINLVTNQEVIALGGDGSSISAGGTKYTWRWPSVGIAKLAATATKPGMYTAHLLNPPAAQPDPTSSSALADTDIGVAATSTIYLENVREVGAPSGHLLSPGTIPDIFICFYRGQWTDGRAIYSINECQ